MKEILIIIAIAVGVTGLTMAGFLAYLTYTNWKIMKDLRDEGFYD